ncbi:GNAT family N-acetyltransferase [Erythrobacter donghaensis]|uniref:GNAT family N-acetyltransferase n=1 Tax=Erythrobacter donghaensis TaxID=267135 RepID=UPI00093EA8BA|nr:GNAT family N-acetyltransferase [Erythrobacter donghaensis]
MGVIRPFRPEDAAALSALTVAAIATLGLRTYSARQVMAWAARHLGPPMFLEEARPGDVILVALSSEGEPAAYTMLREGGLVYMLYCHPDHAGQGLATALLAAIEGEARSAGADRLHTEASEVSRPVFARAGFTLLHRRDFALDMGGEAVPIHNYAMEKCLA